MSFLNSEKLEILNATRLDTYYCFVRNIFCLPKPPMTNSLIIPELLKFLKNFIVISKINNFQINLYNLILSRSLRLYSRLKAGSYSIRNRIRIPHPQCLSAIIIRIRIGIRIRINNAPFTRSVYTLANLRFFIKISRIYNFSSNKCKQHVPFLLYQSWSQKIFSRREFNGVRIGRRSSRESADGTEAPRM